MRQKFLEELSPQPQENKMSLTGGTHNIRPKSRFTLQEDPAEVAAQKKFNSMYLIIHKKPVFIVLVICNHSQ